MADLFLSQFFGDDSNNGLTVNTAKKTLAGIQDIVSSADTVNIYPGIYFGSLLGKINIIGIGKAIIDGKRQLDIGVGNAEFVGAAGNGISVNNLEIRNFLSVGICIGGLNGVLDATIDNVIIHNCGDGIRAFNNLVVGVRITRATIYDCIAGIWFPLNTSASGIIDRSTIYGCSEGILYDGPDLGFIVTNTILSQNEVAIHIVDTDAGQIDTLDGNIYDVASGQFFGYNNTTQFDTFSGWKTFTSADVSSQEADPQFANPDFGIFSVLPGSPAESGALDSEYVGSRFTEVGWYNTTLLESGAVTSGLAHSGVTPGGISGVFIPQNGISFVELGSIDIERVVHISGILDRFLERRVMIDSDQSDNSQVSGEITLQFKIAQTSGDLVTTNYTDYNMRTPITSGDFTGRFIQARLGLG